MPRRPVNAIHRTLRDTLREKEREFVRILAHEHGLTIDQIAEGVPFSKATIRRWIKVSPTPRN